MATTTINYSANTAIAIDLANLASSSTYLAGRESNQIDNTSNKYTDAIVSGFISVGTTPTINTIVAVYVWGADTSLATTAIDTLVGTDAARTLTNAGILTALRWCGSISVPATTSNVQYPILPFSVASRFGGVLPKYWGIYVAHNTGVALRNTAVNKNSLEYVGIKYDVA